MPSLPRRPRLVPCPEALETRLVPATAPLVVQNFDAVPAGTLPTGWSRWSSQPGGTFSSSPARSLSASHSLLAAPPTSQATQRAWPNTLTPADATASAAVYLDSLVPAQVLLRGRGLNTPTPSYYAVSLTRGLEVSLVRVVNGVTTPLRSLRSVGYFSGQWARVSLTAAGTQLRVQVQRADTGQYLNAAGQWQSSAVNALETNDAAIAGGGLAGVARLASYPNAVAFDDFRVSGVAPSSLVESFDQTGVGNLPAGWAQWNSGSGTAFQASARRPLSGVRDLTSTAGTTRSVSRAWPTTVQLADVQASAALYLDSLAPAGVIVRGQNLNTSRPTYYTLRATRGLQLELARVVNGVSTTVARLGSASHFSNQWVRLTLFANGGNLRAMVVRPDTNQYLGADGRWQTERAWAMNLTDTGLTWAGYAGLERPAQYSGPLSWDDFSVLPAAGDSQPPTVNVSSPTANSTLTGITRIRASASDNVGVAKVEVYLDGVLQTRTTTASVDWEFDTTTASNGPHTLTVLGYDVEGNLGRATVAFNVFNNTGVSRPEIPRHYSHIRIAQLAYTGTPFGTTEDRLLRESVDLVITPSANLARLNQTAPATPKMLYSNVSNIYEGLLTDWLAYADARRLDRESAFYHAASATSFNGNSASSVPVTWFWSVLRDGATWTNFTSQARGSVTGGVPFGGLGTSVYVGGPDRFRELNVILDQAAGAGWSAAVEYPRAVDAAGRPTAWGTMPLLSNGTAGLTRSGQILFDPPADWKAASVNGSARLYFLRFRATSNGTPPRARTIRGRDYVNARGGTVGTVPAFDRSADANNDGYLNDAEYSRRTAGKDARFVSESRLFHGAYGQMRFAANPTTVGFRDWVADYHARTLAAQPLASGFFMDNSAGTLPINSSSAVEPTASYANDFGAALNAVARRIAPKWVLANTVGGGTASEPTIRKVQGYFEEFIIRPLSHNYNQFEDVAALVGRRTSLRSPAPYAVLDSHPNGGSPTDPRTQLATLAYYYLLADPVSTFLNFYGGYEPATTWSRHWSPAAAYNVGQPLGTWSQFATGTDPSNGALNYRVYRRTYTNALVLYKPLSRGSGGTGTLADNSATTHALGGSYRVLQANGSLGPTVTSVSLRNGEGAILIRT